MKKILFASTALAALAIGGAASAEIELFGDARLGAGYKVDNDGNVRDTEDEIQAISRVRFGVTMTGESDAGITFGATIRADNAIAGEGTSDDPDGRDFTNQRAGSVFVSGAFGTLTFGDIDEAHQYHVGDLPELGLTGLGFFNELPYLGNRGGVPDGRDEAEEFDAEITGDNYRPTVRYDYTIAGAAVSVSTGSRLDSVAVGASYTFDFGGASLTAGGGYFDGEGTAIQRADPDVPGDVDIVEDVEANQWAAGIEGTFGGFNGQVSYTTSELDDEDYVETAAVGLGTTVGVFGVNAFYVRYLENAGGEDDDEAYGVDMTVDLGGGAAIKGGVVRTPSIFEDEDGDTDNELIADFGISLAF